MLNKITDTERQEPRFLSYKKKTDGMKVEQGLLGSGKGSGRSREQEGKWQMDMLNAPYINVCKYQT
jgi:hypothetical protein